MSSIRMVVQRCEYPSNFVNFYEGNSTIKYNSSAECMYVERSVYTNADIISVAETHSESPIPKPPGTRGREREEEGDNWSLGHRFRVTRNPIRRTICPSRRLFHSGELENRVERTNPHCASPSLFEFHVRILPFSFCLSRSMEVKGAPPARGTGIRDFEVKERATRFPT